MLGAVEMLSTIHFNNYYSHTVAFEISNYFTYWLTNISFSRCNFEKMVAKQRSIDDWLRTNKMHRHHSIWTHLDFKYPFKVEYALIRIQHISSVFRRIRIFASRILNEDYSLHSVYRRKKKSYSSTMNDTITTTTMSSTFSPSTPSTPLVEYNSNWFNDFIIAAYPNLIGLVIETIILIISFTKKREDAHTYRVIIVYQVIIAMIHDVSSVLWYLVYNAIFARTYVGKCFNFEESSFSLEFTMIYYR